jgi:hypothetical protein
MRSHFAVRTGVLLQLMIDKFVGFMSDDEDGPSDGVRTVAVRNIPVRLIQDSLSESAQSVRSVSEFDHTDYISLCLAFTDAACLR